MFYGYEQPVQLPSMGVFDTSMMQADIAAAREIYNQAKDDYDKYMEKYSDFVSPVYGATEAFDSLTRGRMQNVVNELYSNGQDPLRSSIGRAALQNAIRTTDYGTLNALKQQAKDYEAYQNMRREMVAKGLTTDAFEDWRLRQLGLDNFTAMDGNTVRQWTRLTPEQLKSISQLTDDIYKGLKTTTPNGTTPDGKYDVLKVSDLDRAAAKKAGLDAVRKSPVYEFYKEMAGGSDEALADLIENTNAQYLQDSIAANKEYEAAINYKYSAKLENLRFSHQKQLQDDAQQHAKDLAELNNRSKETIAGMKSKGRGTSNSNSGKNGQFSAYNANSNSVTDNIDKQVTSVVEKSTKDTSNGLTSGKYVGKNTSGENLYIFRLPTKGNNNYENVVLDNKGYTADKDGKIYGKWFTSTDGKKHYRYPTQHELQTVILNNYVNKNKKDYVGWFNQLSAPDQTDILKKAFAQSGLGASLGDLTGNKILASPAMGSYIFSPRVVRRNAHGLQFTGRQSETLSDQKKIRDLINDTSKDCVIESLGKTGDVILNNGKKGKYVLARLTAYTLNKTPQSATDKYDSKVSPKKYDVLIKIGEYELGSDGMWVPSAKWDSFMRIADANISSDVVGQSKSVDISNIEAGGEDMNMFDPVQYNAFLQSLINNE